MRITNIILALGLLFWAGPARLTSEAQEGMPEDPPDVLYQQGIRLFLAGDYAGAISRFKPIVEFFSEEPELQQAMERVFYALGCSYYNEGLYGEAIESFNEYVRRFPDADYVDEALFRIGVSHQSSESYAEAVEAYQQLQRDKPRSDFAEDAAFQIGVCYLIEEDYEQVVTAFRAFVDAYPGSALCAQAYMFMARGLFVNRELDQALDVLDTLAARRESLDHLVYVNFLAIEIGDEAFDQTDYETALRAYRRVRTRATLLRLQQGHMAKLEGLVTQLQNQKRSAKTILSTYRRERRLQASLLTAEEMYKKLQGMPNYDAGLYHRIGSCFLNSDRFWEARVAFQRVVDEAKDKGVKEAAYFDLATVLSRLRRFDQLVEVADEYLKEFGTDQEYIANGRVANMAFMRAEAYVNQQRFEEAYREMLAVLDTYPDLSRRPRAEFYVALSAAMIEKFDESISRFETWLAAYPNHMLRAEVEYWLPIAKFFNEQYEEALPAFRAYAAKYPMMVYAPEAEYRAALCEYALERFAACADALKIWIAAHPDHFFKWEARLTRADALAASGQLEEAKAAYQLVTKEAGGFYFLALMQASKVYKALGTEQDLRELAGLFLKFIRDNPDSPNIVDAAYQAGTALRSIGLEDEARRHYWSILQQYGNNRGWEGFELLLDDLARLYQPLDPAQIRTDYEAALSKAQREKRPTLAARLSLALADLADPAEQLTRRLEVANRYPINVLGPETLAALGALFIEKDRPEVGRKYLERLLEEFPKSRYAATGYLWQAREALAQEAFEECLGLAEQAIQSASAPDALMEGIYLRGRARLGLKAYEAAVEDFNLVIANRASPRELKPDAMLGIAAVHEAKGEYREAIPYYQRVYVLYGAYEDAVAKAYLRSGLAFEHLKDWQAAAKTYREMLAVDSMRNRDEGLRARKRLERLQS